jgi:hypothetical protein
LRAHPLLTAAAGLLALAPPASAGWQLGGHAKGQFSFQLFRPDEIGALLVGEDVYLNTGDFRLNTLYRRGAWDVTAQGQLFVLQGNLLEARGDPRAGDLGSSLFPLPDPSDAQQVFDLSWTISEGDSHLLFGRMDRLSVGFTEGPLAARVGRQALSWGNGLVFQVLDLFNPFPPNALDTEYKPGSDMLTAQWLFTNGDDLQGVVVPRRADRSQPLEAAESSAALKWRHVGSAVQVELLGARHYQDTVFGTGLSGNLAGGVVRLDLAETFTHPGGAVTSLVLDFDRSWTWAGRNLYGFGEYFRNGFGETSLRQGIEGLPPPLVERLVRGELFSLGRDEIAIGARLEWTALTTLETTTLVNLHDLSTYLLFRVHHDWRENLGLDAGVQVGLGGRVTEYGGVWSSDLDTWVVPGRTFWARVTQYF